MKEEKIRCVAVEPFRKPYIKMLDNTLKAMQEAVGGLIDFVLLDGFAYALINDEGKLLELPPNRIIATEDGKILDYFAGTFYITGPADEEGETTSLTVEQANYYIDMFDSPVLIGRDRYAEIENMWEER